VVEISRQVGQSAAIASKAVTEAGQTNERVKGLAFAADKIGSIVELINQVAGKTNLLALNATIEAARAGEAGKGFAVVAAEVKLLADQTAKATAEISAQIGAMQDASSNAADAIQGIGATIESMNDIAAQIASSVSMPGRGHRRDRPQRPRSLARHGGRVVEHFRRIPGRLRVECSLGAGAGLGLRTQPRGRIAPRRGGKVPQHRARGLNRVSQSGFREQLPRKTREPKQAFVRRLRIVCVKRHQQRNQSGHRAVVPGPELFPLRHGDRWSMARRRSYWLIPLRRYRSNCVIPASNVARPMEAAAHRAVHRPGGDVRICDRTATTLELHAAWCIIKWEQRA
jgi:hypothetical protein